MNLRIFYPSGIVYEVVGKLMQVIDGNPFIEVHETATVSTHTFKPGDWFGADPRAVIIRLPDGAILYTPRQCNHGREIQGWLDANPDWPNRLKLSASGV